MDRTWVGFGDFDCLGIDHFQRGGAVMAKEWFTAGELRGAKVPGIDAALMRRLARDYQTMTANQARVKPYDGSILGEVEFHISVIPEFCRAQLQAFYGPGSVYERISRLGICRPVPLFHQAGTYVGFGDDAEIISLDEILKERRRRLEVAAP